MDAGERRHSMEVGRCQRNISRQCIEITHQPAIAQQLSGAAQADQRLVFVDAASSQIDALRQPAPFRQANAFGVAARFLGKIAARARTLCLQPNRQSFGEFSPRQYGLRRRFGQRGLQCQQAFVIGSKNSCRLALPTQVFRIGQAQLGANRIQVAPKNLRRLPDAAGLLIVDFLNLDPAAQQQALQGLHRQLHARIGPFEPVHPARRDRLAALEPFCDQRAALCRPTAQSAGLRNFGAHAAFCLQAGARRIIQTQRFQLKDSLVRLPVVHAGTLSATALRRRVCRISGAQISPGRFLQVVSVSSDGA